MFPRSSLLATITSSNDQAPETASPEQPTSLDDIPSKPTISDAVNREKATNALPDSWKLKFDLTYGESGNLTEIAVIHHPSQLVEYHLEPVETYEPLSATRVSVEDAGSADEELTTADDFKTACEAVVEHIEDLEQRTQTPTEATWNSASPTAIEGPDANRSSTST